MNPDNRNARVIGLLVGAMTVGASVLLALEPAGIRWGGAPLLAMRNVSALESARICFIASVLDTTLAEYDCVILPSGDPIWQPRSAHIRVAVVGDGKPQLPEAQVEALLAILGNLTQTLGLSPTQITLDGDSDPRIRTDLPPAATNLAGVLSRKGIAR